MTDSRSRESYRFAVRQIISEIDGLYSSAADERKLHLVQDDIEELLVSVHKLMHIGFGGGVDQSESYVVKAIAKTIPENGVIFDVGTHEGNYADLLLCSTANSVKLWCFEPTGSVFRRLQNKFRDVQRVKVVNQAISNEEGQVILYSDREGSGMSSLGRRDLKEFGLDFKCEERVSATTLDSFCALNGVSRINFVKIDVEGYELAVIRGAEGLISRDAIDFIQFEFGGTDIDSRVFLRDFFRLLEAKYSIYRLCFDGVTKLSRYKELYEIFRYSNFLAVSNKIQARFEANIS